MPNEIDAITLATAPSIMPTMIADDETLARRCADWSAVPAIAVDTEFVRERTYFPGLGLVQISDGQRHDLVDVLAIDDLSPLGAVFRDPSVVKVFHACGEDLETLYHNFETLPTPLFDTQLAAALTGHGAALGYRALTAAMCGVDIPKGETRTNWLRRPLTPQQIRYAALDVVYLLPIYDTLRAALEDQDRLGWLAEDTERLLDVERFLPDPEICYRRLKGGSRLRGRSLAMLQALAAWRERKARQRNQPRSFVVPDAALVQIARLAPRRVDDLARIDELSPRARQRYGRALIEAVRRGAAVPAAERPTPPSSPPDPSAARDAVKALQAVVREVARGLGLPPEVLANRRTLAGIVLRHQRGEAPFDTDRLRGWRRPLLHDAVIDALHR